MPAGAFLMVYLLTTYLKKPLTKAGTKLGLTGAGSAGVLAAAANVLAIFGLIKNMPLKIKLSVLPLLFAAVIWLALHK